MIDSKPKTDIFVLIGGSGCGKDTLLKGVIDKADFEIHRAVTCTTRPMREGEVDGKDYFFRQSCDWDQIPFAFRNYNVSHNVYWHYWLDESSIRFGVPNILILDYQGFLALRRDVEIHYSNVRVYSIYIDLDIQDRLKRALNRTTMTNQDCLELCRRTLSDSEDIDPNKDKCDALVHNADLDQAIFILECIITKFLHFKE